MRAARRTTAAPTTAARTPGVSTTAVRRLAVVAVALAAALAGCVGGGRAEPDGSAAAGTPAGPLAATDADPPDVDPGILPARQIAPTSTMRLADGLSPPTNRWFSALALGDTAQPVFPRPLAVGLTEAGFGVGVPELTTTQTAVMGSYTPQVTIDVGATDPVVTAYDAASVTVDLGTGTLTLVEGSPVLHWTATTAGTVTWDVPFEPGGPAGSAVAAVGERTWLLLASTPDGTPATPALADDGRSAEIPAGGRLAWLALPDDADPTSTAAQTLAEAAVHPPAPTTLRWAADDAAATTAIDLGAPTAVVRLPHQSTPAPQDDLDCDGLGTYATVLGAATACVGRTTAWSVPTVPTDATLDVVALTDDERAELADVVTADTERLTGDDAPAYPADTYFGTKALARDARLLTLATALGLDEPAARLRERIGAELRLRADPDGCTQRAERCFVLDPVLATVVGLPPGFGSDEANDHHFHYGYLLEAAALAAADDAEHGDGTLA